jgi:hypothetical protein
MIDCCIYILTCFINDEAISLFVFFTKIYSVVSKMYQVTIHTLKIFIILSLLKSIDHRIKDLLFFCVIYQR